MDIDKLADVIHQIVHPGNNDAIQVLESLELSDLPSGDDVHRQLEENLLLPCEQLPSHWLPSYQVCGGL